jgi:ribonuclease PH
MTQIERNAVAAHCLGFTTAARLNQTQTIKIESAVPWIGHTKQRTIKSSSTGRLAMFHVKHSFASPSPLLALRSPHPRRDERTPVTARHDGRRHDQLRPISIEPNFMPQAEGSALVKFGDTWVICTVSMEDRVPAFLRGTGSGWVTAEYGMLPRSTNTRSEREAARGRQSGRSQEIQRLIGRALRSVTKLDLLGERNFIVDCDVIKADGGTRTAAITGSCVALAQALDKLVKAGAMAALPMSGLVAAVSVGVVGVDPVLDLDYPEDSSAEVDFNVVMTDRQAFVEVQGTAEGEPFDRAMMDRLVELAANGITELNGFQRTALANLGIEA